MKTFAQRLKYSTRYLGIYATLVVLITGCEPTGDEDLAEDAQVLQELRDRILGNLDELQDSGEQTTSESTAINAGGDNTPNVKTIEWTDLMPKEDLEALANPPEYIDNTEDGSEADTIDSQLKNTSQAQPPQSAEEARYQQALVSTNVVPEMANKKIRLPGFIVPLVFNDQEQITEFFLVPFFGACLHIPAPPPNQIIFVRYPRGLRVEHLYDPIWVTGRLEISMTENDTASAAYSMTMENYEDYPYRG